MATFNGIITPSGTAVQVSVALGLPVDCYLRKIEIEPLRGNTAPVYVGGPNVTSNGTGAAYPGIGVAGHQHGVGSIH
jgi:hypothetical protein